MGVIVEGGRLTLAVIVAIEQVAVGVVALIVDVPKGIDLLTP